MRWVAHGLDRNFDLLFFHAILPFTSHTPLKVIVENNLLIKRTRNWGNHNTNKCCCIILFGLLQNVREMVPYKSYIFLHYFVFHIAWNKALVNGLHFVNSTISLPNHNHHFGFMTKAKTWQKKWARKVSQDLSTFP